MNDEDLRSPIFTFKKHKAPGYDGITLDDIRRSDDVLEAVRLIILNSDLETGVFPSDLKVAVVKPLYKGRLRPDMDNYRPISILRCLSLILERYMLGMTCFLDKFNDISSHQYEFVFGRGTQSLLEEFCDELWYAFDNNQVARALFLNVAKALDTVSHRLLLIKLCNAGCRGRFSDPLIRFLCERRHAVLIANVSSRRFSFVSGFLKALPYPRRFCFNIYVNGLASGSSFCERLQCADDSLLLSRYLNYRRAVKMLQENAVNITK